MPDDRKAGTISRLIHDKVYGFICCPADERDYFFHKDFLENVPFARLEVGDLVTFVVGQSPKGPQAEQVVWERHTGVEGSETRAQVGLPVRKPHTPRYRRS